MSTEKVVPLYKAAGWSKPVSGLAERLLTEANAVANVYNSELAGFVLFAVDKTGAWSLGARHTDDPEHPLGQTMLAGLAQAAIQRNLVADPAAVDVLIRHGLAKPPANREP